jgi:flagellar hook-associated protein 1 FlgK
MQTTTNNVANANTPGYSREEAVLVATNPVVLQPLTFGTGVTLQSVESIRDKDFPPRRPDLAH